MTHIIDTEVNVSSFYFRGGKGMKTFPRQIEWDNQFITFGEVGLRYLIHRGKELVQLFDMKGIDGTTYRLRQEDKRWTLVGTL